MDDHEIAETVNMVVQIAEFYHGTQQLRQQISQYLVPKLKQQEKPISDEYLDIPAFLKESKL